MGLRIYTGEPDLPDENLDAPESHFLGQYIPLHYHCNMLQDEDRVGAFREAIELCVEPGMKVLELGGGTGILSFLAARQGAQVTCVERNPELVRCAQRFLKQNGMADVVEVVADDACRFVPREPVDIVVCEMLHVALLREKQLAVIDSFKNHYRETFSQSLPRFLPEASILMVQPVEQSFDFSGYWAPVPLFHAPTEHREGTQELGSLSTYSTIIYDEAYSTEFHWKGQLSIQKSGRLTALRFITQNAIAIDVAGQRAINWPNQCLVLPVDEPFEVKEGQSVQVEFQYSAGDSIEALSQSLCVREAKVTSSPEEQAGTHDRSPSDFRDVV
ncbi:MAG: methyltransferase domain-containing protein [Planctomycetes bacterium]|nr:methyltransferase domain-containing protein [Planctomycetota bacterium]